MNNMVVSHIPLLLFWFDYSRSWAIGSRTSTPRYSSRLERIPNTNQIGNEGEAVHAICIANISVNLTIDF